MLKFQPFSITYIRGSCGVNFVSTWRLVHHGPPL